MQYYQEPVEDLFPVISEHRTRVDSSMTNDKDFNSYIWSTNQVPKPAKPASYCICARGTMRSMTDVVTRRFGELSSAGRIVNTPMSSTKTRLTINAAGGFRLQSPSTSVPVWYTYHEVEGCCLSTRAVDPLLVSGLLNDSGFGITDTDRSRTIGLASTSARSRIESPTFQGLVSIGELRETLSYLRNPFKTGIKLASKLERDLKMAGTGTRKGATSSEIASLYLEFRYAVRPLIYDVQKAQEAYINQQLALKPIRKTARAMEILNREWMTTQTSSFSGILYDEVRNFQHSLTARAGFMYEFFEGSSNPNYWGTRLSDIPAAMWELTPLSFVYDWIGNCGDFISAITPIAGIRHLAAWTVVEERRVGTFTGTNYRSTTPGTVTLSSGVSSMTIEVVTKSRTPSVNPPTLEWKGFEKLSNDALKIFDLIGIFKQKMDPLAKGHDAFLREQKFSNAFDKRIRKI